MNYSTTADYRLGSAEPQTKGTSWLAAATRMLRFALGTPALSPEQHTAQDAARVRALAYRYRDIDPGFASDLYAAADRHEQSIEAGAGAKG
jgi:hypothetical protein